jgi:6,7-dimethyl-8-ribityllumazine synthase
MQSDSTTPRDSSDLHIAILVSSYHQEVTSKMQEGAIAAFMEAGGSATNCCSIEVAGAWELPIVAQKVASSGRFDAIVTLGCIITGETTHDAIIGHAIAKGLMQTALSWGKPVSMGVLTCQTIEQAKARAGGNCGNKGIEAMNAAIETATTLREEDAK